MIHPEMLCPECEPQGHCRFMREGIAVDAARRDMIRSVSTGPDAVLVVGEIFQAAANRVMQEEIEPAHPQCPYNANVRAHKN